MLYLDSSALVKRYLRENGSQKLAAKLSEAARANDAVLLSFLSYAEIHAVLGRKLRDRSLPAPEYHWAAARFESDWRTNLTPIEVSQLVLDLIPGLVKRHPLKAADAIQLASALWAANAVRPRRMQKPSQGQMVFATSDKQLAAAAEYEQFEVFNPEVL